MSLSADSLRRYKALRRQNVEAKTAVAFVRQEELETLAGIFAPRKMHDSFPLFGQNENGAPTELHGFNGMKFRWVCPENYASIRHSGSVIWSSAPLAVNAHLSDTVEAVVLEVVSDDAGRRAFLAVEHNEHEPSGAFAGWFGAYVCISENFKTRGEYSECELGKEINRYNASCSAYAEHTYELNEAHSAGYSLGDQFADTVAARRKRSRHLRNELHRLQLLLRQVEPLITLWPNDEVTATLVEAFNYASGEQIDAKTIEWLYRQSL